MEIALDDNMLTGLEKLEVASTILVIVLVNFFVNTINILVG